jgi:hypothetical protein
LYVSHEEQVLRKQLLRFLDETKYQLSLKKYEQFRIFRMLRAISVYQATIMNIIVDVNWSPDSANLHSLPIDADLLVFRAAIGTTEQKTRIAVLV